MTTMISRPAHDRSMPKGRALDATNSRSANHAPAPDRAAPSGPTSPAAIVEAAPEHDSPQGTKLPRQSKRPSAPVTSPTGEASTTGGHHASDAHALPAAGLDHAASHGSCDAQILCAGGVNVPSPADEPATTPSRESLLDPALALAADILDDLERVRIANQNRLRQLTRTEVDKDGETRGFGYDPDHPDVMRVGLLVFNLEKMEHDAALALGRKLRKHPLGAWVKATKGVGEKQAARLLAAIGDPYIRPELLNEDGSVRSKEGPRTVSALWAYCGLHVLPGGHHATDTHGQRAAGGQHRDTQPDDDAHKVLGVAAKRRKGERSNWSTKAKMRAYLIAESCIKQLDPQCKEGRPAVDDQTLHADSALRHVGRGGQSSSDTRTSTAAPACACSPYRVVYDERRAHTAVTHPEWTDGHSHNDALRVASKEILKDLWRAARDWHLTKGAQK